MSRARERQIRLPDEQLVDVPLRRIAIVVAVPLLLLALLNAATVVYLALNPVNKGYWLNARKWDLLASLDDPVATLVLGDSSCNQGVDPTILTKTLGGRSLNLCTTGFSILVDDAWMLGAYIDRFGPPERVVVGHAYDVWKRDERLLAGSLWTFAAHRELWQGRPPAIDESPGERIRTALARWVPLYTQETTLIALLRQPRRIFERRRFETTDLGFMEVTHADPVKLERDIRAHQAFTESNDFEVSRMNEAALGELARLARDGGFSLYLVNSPLPADIFDSDTFRDYYADVNAHLAEASEREGLRHLLADPMLFADAELENADHVTRAGARRYSERIAAEISRLEGGSAADQSL